jgi:glutamate-5-semialdehyde dehydrogenase
MSDVREIAQDAKKASRLLALASCDARNGALLSISGRIWDSRAEILRANAEDVAGARAAGLSEAMVDRLLLNEARLGGVVKDLRSLVDLPDPVGEIFDESTMPNGLKIRKQRVPLGVLAVIYEARPNVTVDVSGLALKSGNCAVLRGGSETIRSNRALVKAIQEGLLENGFSNKVIQLIDDPDRKLVLELLQQDEYINMVIPRGGAGLHDFCRKNSRIPVITGGIGICHLFVDESADLEASLPVIENAKIQRPSVCNALDTVLVHEAVAGRFLPTLVSRLKQKGVSFRADETSARILAEEVRAGSVLPAGSQDFDTEWLSLVLGIKVVKDTEEAIAHIAAHSTAHSDGILTSNEDHASQFIAEVDSAAVYVNASTRFTDGSQLGLGSEVAISTQRLHARGPMGLRELTTFKWVIQGNYNFRP